MLKTEKYEKVSNTNNFGYDMQSVFPIFSMYKRRYRRNGSIFRQTRLGQGFASLVDNF